MLHLGKYAAAAAIAWIALAPSLAVAQTATSQSGAPSQDWAERRTLRETRPDGVTVSIPRDLVRPAPGGTAMGYTDATPGPGPDSWIEPAAVALGHVAPTAGARAVLPGPNAAALPNASTRARTTQSYQAFSAGTPDAAVNSAPLPAPPLQNPRANRMFLNKCSLAERYLGC